MDNLQLLRKQVQVIIGTNLTVGLRHCGAVPNAEEERIA